MNNDLYRDRDSRLNTVVGDGKTYWAMLGNIAREVAGPDNPHGIHIQAWCETHYGFRMVYDQDGGITADHEVLDSQKYTLCVLKHGG
jgi:hypothetical protein